LKKKINILIVSPFPPPYGGVANYSNQLKENLDRITDINVRIYDTSYLNKFRFSLKDDRRNYSRIFNPINYLFNILIIFDIFYYLISLLIRKKTIIHVHTCSFFGWWRSYIYVLIAKICRHKTILHVHNAIDEFYVNESGLLGKYFIRNSIDAPDHIVTLSKGIKQFLSKITKTPITPIYNGVEVSFFDCDKQYDRPLKILFCGYVGNNKGVGDLINAIKKTNLEKKDIQLTVIGMGEVKEMKYLCDKINISEQVRFLGHVSDETKIKNFKSHHILALPSYAEGQPIVILEGLSAGMYILSSKVGSIPEIINESNGLLIEPGNVEQLSMFIIRIFNDSNLKIYGENNKILASEKFSFSRVVKDNVKLYKSLNND